MPQADRGEAEPDNMGAGIAVPNCGAGLPERGDAAPLSIGTDTAAATRGGLTNLRLLDKDTLPCTGMGERDGDVIRGAANGNAWCT
mmetsp:Transcript_8965/g.16303  ORF Transcript_8965/g.16303 Transcript_8965/m.16303 type:complete len:86 (-) Transcript_8965:170-427(-)